MKRSFTVLFAILLMLVPMKVHAAGTGSGDPAVISETAGKNAVDFLAEYEARIYGPSLGLSSTAVNTIAQAPDGYIWVGTYSGLYRYDGVRFEMISIDRRIASVMTMLTDSRGYLWIGTNDSGLGRLDIATGELSFYTTAEGLSSDSVRCLAEDEEGNIYVGTVSDLCIVRPSGEVSVLFPGEDVTGVRSIAYENGTIASVTNGGELIIAKEGKITARTSFDEKGIYYETVSSYRDDLFLVGTSGNELEVVSCEDGSVKRVKLIITGEIRYHEGILYDQESEGIYFSGENGMGFIDSKWDISVLSQSGFDRSVGDILKDSQGNIWFVSDKQGVMEYTKNPFVNVFVKAGLESSVVNSLTIINDDLYIAMDKGLAIIDRNTYEKRDYEYLSYFEGVRIRHLMLDSLRNLWVSTYGQSGLIKVSPEGAAVLFNEADAGTLGGRFRYCLELSDGEVVAASNMGLNFIKDDRVVATLGEEDGMKAPQILTMVEKKDGSILAGSDGDGIYIIKDRKITGRIGSEEGLNSLVVLRIVPCDTGFLYVTSNAIYYDDGKSIRILDAFPYTNNYDIYISGEEAWISSSAGIFIVRLSDLIANKEGYPFTLLDYSRGFNTALTSNAWNTIADTGDTLLLCCTDGVRRISVKTYDSFGSDFNIWVKNVSCDDKKITSVNGTYVLPKDAKRIEVQAAVLNYTLSNPLVHLYFEGANDEGTTVYQDELTALTFTNLPYGRYKLHVEVLDGTTRETELDRVFDFYKEPKITELLWVRLLLVLAAMGVVAFIVWRVLLETIIRRQNEELKVAKDEADRANTAKSRFLANMSHEIRTPINTILGMDEMILREDKSLPVKAYSYSVTGYARSIKRATESLLGLVNDILDLSKIESGKMNLVEREYDTAEFLRAITTMIRVKANEKDLLFNIDIDPEIPSKLYGDDGKIKQVILNMLTNAVKYTKQGSFTLRLKLMGKEGDHCSIHYSVQDTGMGIKPEDMEKLFSAFERLDEKENSGIQGTGLGLNISRQFVELMGDELECESEYGKGSKFFFTLSQRIVDETPMGEFSETEASSDEDEYVPLFVAPEARVLVVDDNEMNLLVIKSLLKETKVIIDTATSGRQCLEKINSANYDIILLDHMMPGMDGIETLHELRKTHPDIPVLALTANAVSGEEYYVKEGFQGYLSKPVEGDRLEAKLKEFLPPELIKEWTKEEEPEAPAVKSEEAGDEDPRFDALSAIEDMDLSQGIRYCGSKDSFFAALENFRDALPERYSEIENAYEGEDWEFYTIKVHALKSSARMVGLSGLSEMSKEMEDAGRERNIDAIREKTETLLSLYKEIGEKLEDADLSGTKEDKPSADEGTVNDALEAMRDMAASMDYDSMEMVLDEMKGYSLSTQDEQLFKELNRHLKALDWEGIQEILG